MDKIGHSDLQLPPGHHHLVLGGALAVSFCVWDKSQLCLGGGRSRAVMPKGLQIPACSAWLGLLHSPVPLSILPHFQQISQKVSVLAI